MTLQVFTPLGPQMLFLEGAQAIKLGRRLVTEGQAADLGLEIVRRVSAAGPD